MEWISLRSKERHLHHPPRKKEAGSFLYDYNMESMILVLLGASIFAFNGYLKRSNGRKCPKCGKTAVRTGKMIRMSDGRPIWGYKCSCGEFWYGE